MADAPTILVIEDEDDVRLALAVVMRRAGLRLLEAPDGRTGLRLLYEEHPDCVILDVGLPDLDGWAVLERVRDLSDVPVMMLTARHLEAEKVRGLQAGADDYMTKPFGNQELLARVHALLRRARGGRSPEQAEVYRDDRLFVDPMTLRVEVDGRHVELTALEFRLLHALVTATPRVLSPVQLLDLAWSDPTATAPDRVKYAVHRLRRKLDPTGAGDAGVEALRGTGYRYRPPR